MEHAVPTKRMDWIDSWNVVWLGCSLIVLSSYLKIPFYPISFTMHTCALWVLALMLPARLATGAVILFLGLATVGLPVFGGHANPLWLMGKSSGYLVGYPIAAYLVARFRENQLSCAGIILGHGVIYFLGFLGLLAFVGPVVAFKKGVLLFIPSDLLKIFIAYSVVGFIKGEQS